MTKIFPHSVNKGPVPRSVYENNEIDIYFQDGYGRLYEDIEGGKAELFQFECEHGRIKHQFLKREIPIKLSDEIMRYDLVTPYGYGGPIVMNAKDGQRKELCAAFETAFSEYCHHNNIVSEFVRFHPVVDNVSDFGEMYNAAYLRDTVGTNLEDFDDPVQSEFSKGCRKTIRQATRKGVSYRVTEAPDDISAFLDIYYDTMKRGKAQDFYFFGEEYFENLLISFKHSILFIEALYEENTIAAAIYFISSGLMHAHLSGTRSDFLSLSPAHILKYAATLWGKERGYKLIHHGGGTTNDPKDPLLQFKMKFGKSISFAFHVGKKVWNEEIYKKLCEVAANNADHDFFPAYRLSR